jgi:uncharacterized protein with GYD domain
MRVGLDDTDDLTLMKGANMSTYLVQGCYTSEAIAAMVKKPQDRSAAVRGLVESLGGKVEGFWLSSGEYDFVGIVQFPDLQTAASFSLAAAAGGAVRHFKTVPLLTWAEGMEAFKKAGGAKYRPPTK